MSEALRSMVEAMDAEMERQRMEIHPLDDLPPYDMEKVARAGLMAIRGPSKDQAAAGQDALDDCMDSDWSSDINGNRESYMTVSASAPANVYRAMIDAILKDQP